MCNDKKYAVYKYMYSEEIIYIGKTNSSLLMRINAHGREEKFNKYLSKAKIYYFECNNRIETDIYEKYLINKYKPILNRADKLDCEINIHIEEPIWYEYIPTQIDTSLYEHNSTVLKQQQSEKRKKYWEDVHQRQLDEEIRKINFYSWLYSNWDEIQIKGNRADLYLAYEREIDFVINASYRIGKGVVSFAFFDIIKYEDEYVHLVGNLVALQEFYEKYNIIIKQSIEKAEEIANKWNLSFEL